MTTKKSYPLPRDVPVKTKPTLEQLTNARRPLLFSRMPRMLRGDGSTADTLQHALLLRRHSGTSCTSVGTAMEGRASDVAHPSQSAAKGQRELNVYSCATSELMSRASFSTARSRVANRSTLSDSVA